MPLAQFGAWRSQLYLAWVQGVGGFKSSRPDRINKMRRGDGFVFNCGVFSAVIHISIKGYQAINRPYAVTYGTKIPPQQTIPLA